MFYSKYSDHKGAAGFTLIELLNVMVIIGVLGAVGIPQFSQYKNKAYDVHAKRALKDMHLLCNAFWIDTYPGQACDLPTIKGTYYGFNQNPDVLATLPPTPSDTFCATAKHDSSPNVFSINNASLISSGEKCGVSIVNASFSPRPAYICAGTFQDPCPTIACDEDCTKQKAQDRLLAVINELPDLMKPSSDDIDDSIQEIQSRTYSNDPDGTPTMNENSSVNELLAATMEPPPPPTVQTFESYQPPEEARSGNARWYVVNSSGSVPRHLWAACGQGYAGLGPGGSCLQGNGFNATYEQAQEVSVNVERCNGRIDNKSGCGAGDYKVVYAHPVASDNQAEGEEWGAPLPYGGEIGDEPDEYLNYDFKTGKWRN